MTGSGAGGAAESLRGVLENILYLNEQNGYLVGELTSDDGKKVVITGSLPEVQCGESLELEGEWVQHPRHGRQFQVARFQAALPGSVHGLRKYLGSGLIPGIGPKLAERIVDAFGLETLQVLESDSGRLQQVDGIGEKRAREIKEAWDQQHLVREVMVFLQTYGVTVARCLRLVKKYGGQVRYILRHNPYQLAEEVEGIGFLTADRLARNVGFSNDAPARLEAGLGHVLAAAEDEGHTAVPREELCGRAGQLLGVAPGTLDTSLDALVARGEVAALEGGLVQSTRLRAAEESMARSLGALGTAMSLLPPIKVEAAVTWAEERAGFAFAPEQAEAVRVALKNPVTVLTGGPGTGKTTILRAVADILQAKKARLLLASPTGRAAQRLSEATNCPAATLHRLLKWNAAEQGFHHNRNRPLPCEFLIVDEASMLDSRLAAAVFAALPVGAHLLLVGDADQLPSVGPGQVLQDLIESGKFPVVRLRRVFRQGQRSPIVDLAHGVMAGETRLPLEVRPTGGFDPGLEAQFVYAPEAEACAAAVAEIWRALRGRWASRDVQVLTAMHKGPCGTGNLNRLLQSLGPEREGVAAGPQRLQVGDKVLHTRNHYDRGLFNGDMGEVVSVQASPARLEADFDGARVTFDRGEWGDLTLAYAITIHKSQGSEFPVVIIPLVRGQFLLLQRNLVYTAITRARKQVVLVGDPAAYGMAVRNARSSQRHTALGARLAKGGR